MPYATSNPPILVRQGIAGQREFYYSSVDAVTAVRVAGYFTNGWDLGMRAGDTVVVLDNDAVPLTGSLCWVATATSASVNLSDGTTITGTNTD